MGILKLKNNSICIVFIILLGALLRLIGIFHDYPYSFYPDEAHFVKRALSFGSGDFNPHWFHKPAFYMYILFFEYGLYFVIGKIVGLWQTVADFAVYYIKNPGSFYIIGRLTTMLFGLATIGCVYIVGERHFKKNVGLIGALLLSLSFGHVAACQDIKADIPAAFFAFLSMLFLLNYVQSEKNKHFLIAAGIAGMGTATKDYPIVMMVPIVITIFAFNMKKKEGLSKIFCQFALHLSFALIAFWAMYFICSPYNFHQLKSLYFQEYFLLSNV